jgi:hypothetical protein
VTTKLAQELLRTPTAHVRPVYIRLPAPARTIKDESGTVIQKIPAERCPYTGMSRSGLADICVPNKANGFKPPVRSIYLKKNKYAKRGIRLIDYASLMKFLRSEFAAH